MRNSNPWAFGIIFLAIFAYFAYNNYELPTLFIRETKIISGKIIDIKIGNGPRGRSYVQNVKYAYCIDSIYYFDFKTVNNKYGKQFIGNHIKLEYSVKNPQKNKILGFEKRFIATDKECFYAAKKVGYYQIDLINDMFYYMEFANYGKILDEVVGNYRFLNDTTFEVTPYIYDNNEMNLTYLIKKDSIGKNQLIEYKTGRLFK